jgi:hypothetical protein
MRANVYSLEVIGLDGCGGASQVHGGGRSIVDVGGGDLPVAYGRGGGRR